VGPAVFDLRAEQQFGIRIDVDVVLDVARRPHVVAQHHRERVVGNRGAGGEGDEVAADARDTHRHVVTGEVLVVRLAPDDGREVVNTAIVPPAVGVAAGGLDDVTRVVVPATVIGAVLEVVGEAVGHSRSGQSQKTGDNKDRTHGFPPERESVRIDFKIINGSTRQEYWTLVQ